MSYYKKLLKNESAIFLQAAPSKTYLRSYFIALVRRKPSKSITFRYHVRTAIIHPHPNRNAKCSQPHGDQWSVSFICECVFMTHVRYFLIAKIQGAQPKTALKAHVQESPCPITVHWRHERNMVRDFIVNAHKINDIYAGVWNGGWRTGHWSWEHRRFPSGICQCRLIVFGFPQFSELHGKIVTINQRNSTLGTALKMKNLLGHGYAIPFNERMKLTIVHWQLSCVILFYYYAVIYFFCVFKSMVR